MLSGPLQNSHMGLAILAVTAFVASVVGTLTQLISVSVFFLAVAYLGTSLSLYALEIKHRVSARHLKLKRLVPALGALASVFLLTQVGWQRLLIGAMLLLVGVPIYFLYAPKQRSLEIFEQFFSREAILRRTYEQVERFLAHPIHHLIWWSRKKRGVPSTWHVEE